MNLRFLAALLSLSAVSVAVSGCDDDPKEYDNPIVTLQQGETVTSSSVSFTITSANAATAYYAVFTDVKAADVTAAKIVEQNKPVAVPGPTPVTVDNLASETTYLIGAVAKSGDVYSQVKTISIKTLKGGETPPPGPTADPVIASLVKGDEPTETTISFSITTTDAKSAKYAVYKDKAAADITAAMIQADGTDVAVPGPTKVTVDNLTGGTTYTVAAIAINESKESPVKTLELITVEPAKGPEFEFVLALGDDPEAGLFPHNSLAISLKSKDQVSSGKYILTTKAALDKLLETSTIEEILKTRGNTLNSEWIPQLAQEKGLLLSANKREPETAYSSYFMLTNAKGLSTTKGSSITTAAIPVEEPTTEYLSYIGTWTVTGSRSAGEGDPLTFNVTIKQDRANYTYKMTGWTDAVPVLTTEVPVAFNKETKGITINAVADLGPITVSGKAYTLGFLGLIEDADGIGPVTGDYAALSGILDKGKVALQSEEIGLVGGAKVKLIGMEFFYYYEEGSSIKGNNFTEDNNAPLMPVMTKFEAPATGFGTSDRTPMEQNTRHMKPMRAMQYFSFQLR